MKRKICGISSVALLLLLPSSATSQPENSTSSASDRLRELATLCEENIIPQDECTLRRQVLLDELLVSNTSQGLALDYDFHCNFDGSEGQPSRVNSHEGLEFSESSTVGQAVNELLDYAGISPNFLVTSGTSPNASATYRRSAEGPVRAIIYNASWIAAIREETGSNWAMYGVMGHEIGHHVESHLTRAGNSHLIELEADKYSGRLLARAGATLAEAQLAMSTMSIVASSTHPGRAERLNAIEEGWNEERREMQRASRILSEHGVFTEPADVGGTVIASETNTAVDQPSAPNRMSRIPNLPGQQFTDRCVINGEEVAITASNAVLSINRGMVQVGARVPAQVPGCVFEMISQTRRYCLGTNAAVFQVGVPQPVGQCQRL